MKANGILHPLLWISILSIVGCNRSEEAPSPDRTSTSGADVVCSYAPSQSDTVSHISAVAGGSAATAAAIAQAAGLTAVLHSSGAYIFTGSAGYLAGTMGAAAEEVFGRPDERQSPAAALAARALTAAATRYSLWMSRPTKRAGGDMGEPPVLDSELADPPARPGAPDFGAWTTHTDTGLPRVFPRLASQVSGFEQAAKHCRGFAAGSPGNGWLAKHTRGLMTASHSCTRQSLSPPEMTGGTR